MRRTAWILAALGMAGSTLPPGYAQDVRSSTSLIGTRARPVVSREQAVESESAADAAERAEKKNYYSDLFGTADVESSRSAPTSTAQPARRRTALKPLKQISPTAPEPATPDAASASEFDRMVTRRASSGLGAGLANQSEARKPAEPAPQVTPVADSVKPFPSANVLAKPSGSQRESIQPAPQFRTTSLTDEIAIDAASQNLPLPVSESDDDLPELDFSSASDGGAFEAAPEPPTIPRRGVIVRPPTREPSNPFAQPIDVSEEVDDDEEDVDSQVADDSFTSMPESPVMMPEAVATPEASLPKTSRGLAPFAHGPASNPAATASPAPAGNPLAGRRSLATELAAPAAVAVNSAPRPAAHPPREKVGGVSARWVKKSEITIGKECTCELIVSNDSDVDVTDVELEAYLPSNVDLVGTEPSPTTTGKSLIWKLPSLAAGDSRAMTIRMIPRERGNIATQAFVRFSNAATSTFSVAEPMLALELSGPQQVVVGEPASHTLTVRNPGTGIASNVKIEALIPEGLEHSRGDRLVMDLGALNPGEARPVRLALAAVSGGKHVVEVRARADGDILQTAAVEVSVIAPKLAAEIHGPGLRYLNRQAEYTLTVANEGAAAIDAVRVMHKIPEGFEFVSSDKGGRFDPSTRLLTWHVGSVGVGESSQAHVTLKATQMGTFTHFIRATSDHGVVSDSQVTTQVDGAANLSLDVSDLDDPVEVGVETGYEIRVTNEGSAPARAVTIACQLPEGAVLVTATGPVSHDFRNGSLAFQPITEIAPKESVTFQVMVRGEKPGNLRFKTLMSSESISEPVVREERTKFYGE